MGRACTVCIHPSSTAIDSDLLDGFSGNTIAKEYGVSSDSIKRHRREHLLTGRRPIPTRPEDFDGSRYSVWHKNSEQAKITKIQTDAVWAAAAASANLETSPDTTSGDEPADPVFEGLYEGMGQIKTMNFIIRTLLEEAFAARARSDFSLAISALVKAGNLTLRLMKIAPDGEEQVKPPPPPDAQDELKALIKEMLKTQPMPEGWIVT